MRRRTLGFEQRITWTTLLLSTVVFLCVGLILYHNTAQYFNQKLQESENTNLRQLSMRLNTHFDKLINLADAYAQNPAVQDALVRLAELESGERPQEVYAYMLVLNDLTALMQSLQECYEGVESMALVTQRRSYVQSASALLTYDWPSLAGRGASFEKARLVQTGPSETIGDVSAEAAYIGAGQIAVLRWIGGTGQPALLAVRLSENWLREQLGADAYVTLNYRGAMVLDNGLHSRGEGLTQALSAEDWTLVYHSTRESFLLRSRLLAFLLIFLGVCCLLSFLLCRLLLRRVVEPLTAIAGAAARIASEPDWTGETLSLRRTRYTLCERIMMLFVLSILMPLLVFSVSYSINVSGLLLRELRQRKTNVLTHAAENLRDFVRNKEAEAKLIAFDTTVQHLLIDRAADPSSDAPVEAVVSPYLLVMERYYAVALRDLHGGVLLEAPAGATDALPGEDQPLSLWFGLRTSRTGVPLVSMRMNIYGVFQPSRGYFMRSIGTIQVDVEEQMLQAQYRDAALLENMQVYVLDAQGRVISAREQYLMGQPEESLPLEDVRIRLPISGTGWTLLGSFDPGSLQSDLLAFLLEQIPILLLVILALLFIAFELSHVLTSPLLRISRLLSRVRLFNADLRFPEETRVTEVNRIATAFNAMIERVNRLLREALDAAMEKERLRREKEAAEHVSLQAQINPHFICNALDMARCLIDGGKPGEAAEMMRQINHLFRYGISRQDSLLTVRQEWLYARAYAAILTMRFPDRVRFEWSLDPDLSPLPMMKMTLQPLIENALEHGLMQRKQGGCIRVTGRKEEGGLCFEVADDGVGMEEARLSDLRARLHEGRQEGVGLANLVRRLALSYGPEGYLTIESVKWQGTRVIVHVPVEARMEQEEETKAQPAGKEEDAV